MHSRHIFVKCGQFEANNQGTVSRMKDGKISVGPTIPGCPFSQRNLNLVIRNVSTESVKLNVPRSIVKPNVSLTYSTDGGPVEVVRNVVMHDNVFDEHPERRSVGLLYEGTLAPDETVTIKFHYTLSREDAPSILKITRMQNEIDLSQLRSYNPDKVLEKISIRETHFLIHDRNHTIPDDNAFWWTAGFAFTVFAVAAGIYA